MVKVTQENMDGLMDSNIKILFSSLIVQPDIVDIFWIFSVPIISSILKKGNCII